MPIFEFVCEDCGESFEELLRSTEAASRVVCPNCGATKAKKKISSFASRITGGGSALSASQSSCAPTGT